MMKRHRDQLVELLTNYGPIDLVCLDMWLGPSVWPKLRETLLELRRISPNTMFRARGIGNYGDYYTPERFVPGAVENTDVPWMVIYPLGRSFSYEPRNEEHKGAAWIVYNIIDCVAKGGSFMVGIGLDGNGKFHPTAIAQIKQVGRWLKRNGEGIYETRARDGEDWAEGEKIFFTRSKDGKPLYVHCLEMPVNELIIKIVKPQKKSKITLLATGTPLVWEMVKDKGLVITVPQEVIAKVPADERLTYSFKIIVE